MSGTPVRGEQTVVLLRQDVAAAHYHKPWSELVTTESDGVQVIQAVTQDGQLSLSWTVPNPDAPETPTIVRLTPPGWAAFRLSPHHRNGDTASLFQQNY